MLDFKITLTEEQVKEAVAMYVNDKIPFDADVKANDVLIKVGMKYVGTGMTEEERPAFENASVILER